MGSLCVNSCLARMLLFRIVFLRPATRVSVPLGTIGTWNHFPILTMPPLVHDAQPVASFVPGNESPLTSFGLSQLDIIRQCYSWYATVGISGCRMQGSKMIFVGNTALYSLYSLLNSTAY